MEIERLSERTGNWNWIKDHFSSKTAYVQLGAGASALAGRSAAAYFSRDLPIGENIMFSQLGSFLAYVTAFGIGYAYAFRNEYDKKGEMIKNIIKLQTIEQVPNIVNVFSSSASQLVFMSMGLDPVLSANLGNFLGIHKISNALAMATSNSLNKAWIYESWDPNSSVKTIFYTRPKYVISKFGEMVNGLYSRYF